MELLVAVYSLRDSPVDAQEDMLVVADSKALQHIFHKSSYKYPKSLDSQYMGNKIFGPGVITVQGTHLFSFSTFRV